MKIQVIIKNKLLVLCVSKAKYYFVVLLEAFPLIVEIYNS